MTTTATAPKTTALPTATVMTKITPENLVKLIEETVSGTTTVSLDIVTDPRMKKTANPYLGTMKYVKLNGMLGFDYSNSVNNQQEREGQDKDFTPHERKWGTLRDNRLFVDHKEKVYLQVKVQSASDPIYMLNGSVIDKDKVKPFLPKRSAPKTQDQIEKKIILRDIEMSNIKAIRMNGKSYVVMTKETVTA
jgi:hypothetical protein